jgi:DNA (cytosine-5)-methyltransferase 1
MKPKAIDLFSGCGGLTQGLKLAGFTVLAGVEIRDSARLAYAQNHPEIKLFPDIRELDPVKVLADFKLQCGELDLLAGCPPCQGFSRMRTKNKGGSVADVRNELIFEFVRLAEGLKPKTLMMENVPGLKDDWRMNEALIRLKSAGYQCELRIVDAANFGVPQRRKRMILLCSSIGELKINFGKYKKRTVWDTIGTLPRPAESNNRLHALVTQNTEAVRKRIRKIPKNGGSRMDLGKRYQLKCHRAKNAGFKDVYGRMTWNKVAPTMTRFCTNPSKGRFLHPIQNRAITLFEASLLQGFPKSYKFPLELGKGKIASMIGEALPPPLGRRQAELLSMHIRHSSILNSKNIKISEV